MKTNLTITFLVILFVASLHAQKLTTKDLGEQRLRLLGDRQAVLGQLYQLSGETAAINDPVGKAYAKTEVARSVWEYDHDAAKDLLVNALKLTFPPLDEKPEKGKEVAKGLFAPNRTELGRIEVRNYIFRVAAGDAEFYKALRVLLNREAGRSDGTRQLANTASRSGNIDDVREYFDEVNSTDNYNMDVGQVIYGVAIRDRAAADALILSTLAQLRAKQMSGQAFRRTIAGLDMAVFGPLAILPLQPVQPAGKGVIKDYLSFQIDKLREILRMEPDGRLGVRSSVTSLWLRISEHAPELVPQFQFLEVESRITPNDNTLPQPFDQEGLKSRREQQYQNAFNSRKDSDISLAVSEAIADRDFAKAKELAGLYQDLKKRNEAVDRVSSREVTYLIKNGQLEVAEKILQGMTEANLVLEGYMLLLPAVKAHRETRRSRDLLFTISRRLDKMGHELSLIRPLAEIVGQSWDLDQLLSFDLLGELIIRLNRSPVEPNLGQLDFNPACFESLARVEMSRTRLMAENIKEPIRRISVLSRIFKVKGDEISGQLKKLGTGL